MVPNLVKVHKTSGSQKVKGSCINAVCTVLKEVPSEVMYSEIQNVRLLPFLISFCCCYIAIVEKQNNELHVS